MNKIRRLLKTLRLPRRQHQQRIRKLPLHHAKRNQRQRLFARHHTSRHNQRPPPARSTSRASHSDIGVASGTAWSYFKFPLTVTRYAGAPNSRTRSASRALCIKNARACPSASRKNGRK